MGNKLIVSYLPMHPEVLEHPEHHVHPELLVHLVVLLVLGVLIYLAHQCYLGLLQVLDHHHYHELPTRKQILYI